jgi:putative transposase
MEKGLDLYYPYLFVDVSYFKVCDETRYVNKALLVVVAVSGPMVPGRFLAARVADAECECTWERMFSDPKVHGLANVDLIVSDGHTCSRNFP